MLRFSNTRSEANSQRGGENGNDKPHIGMGIKPTRDKQQFFACPYFILDPARYASCIGKHNHKRYADVKLHLTRRHLIKQYTCCKCWEEFETSEPFETHVCSDACSPRGRDQLYSDELKFLQHTERGVGGVDQWYSMWEKLFGKHGHVRPESPFLNSGLGPYVDVVCRPLESLLREKHLSPEEIVSAVRKATLDGPPNYRIPDAAAETAEFTAPYLGLAGPDPATSNTTLPNPPSTGSIERRQFMIHQPQSSIFESIASPGLDPRLYSNQQSQATTLQSAGATLEQVDFANGVEYFSPGQRSPGSTGT